jgi:hypothetical protein
MLVVLGHLHIHQLGPGRQQRVHLGEVAGSDRFGQALDGDAVNIRLESGPGVEALAPCQHQLRIVQREGRRVGVAVVRVYLCDYLGLAFNKRREQFLRLTPELIEIGPFAQSARGWGLSHYELLSWLRVVRQPLRPVSARAGRKEFIETTTCQRLPGGRSPSRGHGGALLRHGQHTGMVRSQLLEPVNQVVS